MKTVSFIAKHGNSISVTSAGSGPTLMLLHGFPLDHRMWQSQLECLSQHYHVVAPDLRGFGQSTLAEQSYTMADLADDVEAVRQHIAPNQSISLCGLSMGGYVAFEYWKRYGPNLNALILANTKPESDSAAARAARYEMAEQAKRLGAWPAISGMLVKLISPYHLEHKPEIAQTAERILRDCSAEAVVQAQHAMAIRTDFSQHLQSIFTPTLVITGQHDPIAPPDATRLWADKLARGQFRMLASASHLTPLETPDEFNGQIRSFLAACR